MDTDTDPIPPTDSSPPTDGAPVADSRKRRFITEDATADEDYALIPTETRPTRQFKAADAVEAINMDVLKMYYDRLFPVSLMMSWMRPSGVNDADSVKLREFSFTLVDDIYIRYLSFSNRDELKAALVSRVPIKIDLGACYNVPPPQRASVNTFTPLQKELVFDIDMTDYDDVRTCCNEANICPKCWPLMTVAIKVIDRILRDNFGFRHLLWVYSGRRGVHCFVADPRAKKLSNELRTAIVEFLTVYLGKEGGKDGRKLNLTAPLHPTLTKAYETLMPYFLNFVDEQNLFNHADGLSALLEYIDPVIRPEFLWSSHDEATSGRERVETLQKKIHSFLNRANNKRFTGAAMNSVKTAMQRLVFSHVYPRLDVNVSKQLNHLLKSPFCIHPKTGRVCVPIDPSAAEEFSPFDVPTLSKLEQEVNAYKIDADHPASACWTETSLKGALLIFREFVQKLVTHEKELLKQSSAGGGDAMDEVGGSGVKKEKEW